MWHEKIDLPPMPEPKGLVIGDLVQGASVSFAPPNMVSTVDATGSTALFTADQLTAYALLAVKQDRERIDASEVVQFLYGAGDLDGVYYSERPVGKPFYWWRTVLRATLGKG